MEYDYKILEEKFKALPEDIQLALTSVKVADDIKAIADRNGLLIDQEGVLYDLASYVLLGLLPSNQFVKTFAKEANVEEKVATAVAEDINSTVFAKIRSSIQNIQSQREAGELQAQTIPADNSSIEHVGGFTVEPPQAEIPESEPANTSDVTYGDKDSILSGIENPPASMVTKVPKTTTTGVDHTFTEPIADLLLKSASSQPLLKVRAEPENTAEKKSINLLEETSVIEPQKKDTQPAPPPPPKPKGPDQYRELIT